MQGDGRGELFVIQEKITNFAVDLEADDAPEGARTESGGCRGQLCAGFPRPPGFHGSHCKSQPYGACGSEVLPAASFEVTILREAVMNRKFSICCSPAGSGPLPPQGADPARNAHRKA